MLGESAVSERPLDTHADAAAAATTVAPLLTLLGTGGDDD